MGVLFDCSGCRSAEFMPMTGSKILSGFVTLNEVHWRKYDNHYPCASFPVRYSTLLHRPGLHVKSCRCHLPLMNGQFLALPARSYESWNWQAQLMMNHRRKG